MQNIGYDSYNPILNLGSLGLYLAFYFFKLILLGFILWPFTKLTGRGQWVLNRLVRNVFFGDILMLFIEGSMEFQISS
jgi:hypothetical protein